MKLGTTRKCRGALERLYYLGLADKIPASKATKLAYIVGIILKSLEAEEMRWQSAASGPSPAETAAAIRAAMREANGLVPPPGGENDGASR